MISGTHSGPFQALCFTRLARDGKFTHEVIGAQPSFQVLDRKKWYRGVNVKSKPKAIFLDQNKWIDLARGYHMRPGGSRFAKAARAARQAAKQGRAIFPLSSGHIMELSMCSGEDRRGRLAEVLIELSQNWTIAPASTLVPLQIDMAISRTFGKPLPRVRPAVFGKGVPFAFGCADDLHKELGISKARARRLERILDTPAGLHFMLVGGGEELRLAGTSEARNVATTLAQRIERVRAAYKTYSKAVRRRAYLAELTFSLQDDLRSSLSRVGMSLDQFLRLGKKRLTSFWETIPSIHVETELAVERDAHWDRPVDPNDLIDITSLSVSIPYCDVVVTESFWVSLAKRRGLDRKYATILLSEVSDIEDYLKE